MSRQKKFLRSLKSRTALYALCNFFFLFILFFLLGPEGEQAKNISQPHSPDSVPISDDDYKCSLEVDPLHFENGEWGKCVFERIDRLKHHSGVWIRIRLPEMKWKDPAILIVGYLNGLEAWFDQEKIYTDGKPCTEASSCSHDSSLHHLNHLIRFKANPASTSDEAYLYLRMTYAHPYDIGLVEEMIIGEAPYLTFHAKAQTLARLKQEIPAACFGAIFFFVGILSLLIFIFRFSERNYPFLSFGFFALTAGLWFLNLVSLHAAFNLRPRFWITIEWMVTFFMPVGLMALVEQIFVSSLQAFIHRLWQVLAVFACGVSIWFYFGDLPSILVRAFTFIQLFCVMVGFVCIYKFNIQPRISKSAKRVTVIVFLYLANAALIDILSDFHDVRFLFGAAYFDVGILASVLAFGYVLFEQYKATLHASKTYALKLETNKRKLLEIEQANLQARFQALKSQINPHFLFNSFGTLMALVEEKQDLVLDYVMELSNVYRYLLQTREDGLVSLEQELAFIESYIRLVSKRHGKKIKVTTDVEAGYYSCKVPPASIQLLLENALKHNIISSQKPLKVNILIEEDNYITVKNNLQPKKVFETSTQIGLTNLKKQYAFFTDQKVLIFSDDLFFKVKIPLLEKESSNFALNQQVHP